MFDTKAQEKLGYYVYGLFDPDEPGLPFYIGKGCGNRVFDHAAGVLDDVNDPDETMSTKIETIRNIKQRGRDVTHMILRYGLAKDEALAIEATLIDMINYISPDRLTNLISGHGVAESIIDAQDLAMALAAEPLVTQSPLLIIKIEQQWAKLIGQHKSASQIPVKDIYEAVRGDWRINANRAQRADCILAVARGLVRACFVAEEWSDAGHDGRKKFTGRIAPTELDYSGQSVASLFKRGGQNPIRYHNC